MALIGLFASPLAEKTDATIGTASVTLLTYLVLGILSQLEHERTIKPSTINRGYFFLSTLLAVPEARTLYFVQPRRVVPILYTIGLGLRVILLTLESIPKGSILRPAYQNPPVEAATGILGQSLFTWINPLLWMGHGKDLNVEQLPCLEDDFYADGVGPNKLETICQKG